MPTTWAFIVILYTTQAFHPVNPSPMPRAEAFTPFVRPTRQQPPLATTNQTNETSVARLPQRSHIRRLHHGHGTLAKKVPVDNKKNPLFGWHVTVYSKLEATYEQICGGSLVKKDTAISAAHCFWDDAGLMPAELFAVTVGQALRRWRDALRYRSNVSEIIVPPRFLGVLTSFQDDLAVVRLATPVEYQFGVRPVCVDFDLELERWHLRTDFQGLITGFGLTEENGSPSDVLNYQRLPYVDIRACIAASDPGFLKYLTSDKICAGDQKTGRALCRGDSGGGLVFFDGLIESAVMYLRGVASAAPRNDNACNAYAIGSFTHVRAHRTFLRDHIPNLEEECKTVYAKQLVQKYVLKPLKPEEVKNENKTEVSMNEGINRQDIERGTGPQAVANTGIQLVNTGVPNDAHKPNILSSSQDKSLGNPNTSNKNKTQTIIVEISNAAEQKTANPSDFALKGPTKPDVSIPNGNNEATGLLNVVKVSGNTNIFFFTGPVVDPGKFYSQANATPTFVESPPEQPTNIYVFIQN